MPIVDVYRQLQQQLDRMPVPFPPTESGVEIRILKHLFTPDEARIALWLSAIPEPAKVIHKRAEAEMSFEQLVEALDLMGQKGSILRHPGKKGTLYGMSPLALGMYEAQVDRLTPEFERDVREYLDGEFGQQVMKSGVSPQLRTVPVNQALKMELPVASHQDIRAYIESSPGPFGAINCICRQGKDLTGEPCKQTRERKNCLMVGVAATMTIANGLARKLSKEEMLGMLEQADRDGLVLQPLNTQDPVAICCCCGCCCGILTNAKKLDRPVQAFQTDFVAEVEPEKCEVCGTCIVRCQMDAIPQSDDKAQVQEERCIGCGLCVTTCPTGAMHLRRLENTKVPPRDPRKLYTTMYQQRFGRAAMAVALARHLAGKQV